MATSTTNLDALTLSGDMTVGGAATVTGATTFTGALTLPATQAVVNVIRETVALADFTDNTDATGTATLSTNIPVGATVLCSAVTAITGFAGDTSAVLTIGDGTDVDRYNTGTVNVFATAAAGLATGVPSGVQYHAAAKTPTLIVTSDADFTSVSAGSVTVEIYYVT